MEYVIGIGLVLVCLLVVARTLATKKKSTPPPSKEGKDWSEFLPPQHFNCRCVIVEQREARSACDLAMLTPITFDGASEIQTLLRELLLAGVPADRILEALEVLKPPFLKK